MKDIFKLKLKKPPVIGDFLKNFALKLKKPLVRVKICLMNKFKHTSGGIQVPGTVGILTNHSKFQGSNSEGFYDLNALSTNSF